MAVTSPEFAHLAPLLPEAAVGTVTAIEPISMGNSGAGVYAVQSSRGALVLRVQPARFGDTHWTQQLLVLRRAAEAGVAPALIHVDEAARAVVSVRVAGVPLPAALANPAVRGAAVASVVAQLRALHALDATGVEPRDPIAFVRAQYAAQRVRAGFPAWADALDAVFDATEARLARDPRRVVGHNDLNPGNVLWDGARAWLVDWEVAGLAHPFYDLAVFAMFLQLDADATRGLLTLHEGRPVSDDERETFEALRRLSALLCGLTFVSLVPDLGDLPAAPPTLTECYAAMRAGALDLQDPRGRGAFALALLRAGT